jgi:hypothetical protein
MCGRNENCIQKLWLENLEDEKHLGDLVIDLRVRMTLTRALA